MTTTNTYLKGQKAFLGGDLENSINAFSDALKQRVHPFHSHLNRGIAYFKIGQFHHAVKDFDTKKNEDKTHKQTLFYRGIAKLNLEENKETIHDFGRALTLNSNRGATYLARGLAHHCLKHRKETKKRHP